MSGDFQTAPFGVSSAGRSLSATSYELDCLYHLLCGQPSKNLLQSKADLCIYFYMQQVAVDVAHPESAYFDAIRSNTPASTKKIAEAVGVTRQGADYRLRKLQEEGKVESEMIGNSLLWKLPEDN